MYPSPKTFYMEANTLKDVETSIYAQENTLGALEAWSMDNKNNNNKKNPKDNKNNKKNITINNNLEMTQLFVFGIVCIHTWLRIKTTRQQQKMGEQKICDFSIALIQFWRRDVDQ